jgi:hypothetical protein
MASGQIHGHREKEEAALGTELHPILGAVFMYSL